MGKSNSEVEQRLEMGFNAFWTEYPRRDAKIYAQKVWRRLAPSEETIHAILEGVRRYRKSGHWNERQFIPLPSSFLNGRRWEDEIGKGAHEVETPQPRYCAICGHTGSWHLNETKHGRPVDHNFAELSWHVVAS